MMMNMRRATSLAAILSPVWLACGSSNEDSNSGELQVTVSAESLGANGYAFPPLAAQELAFVDGWAVHFDRILVAIDNIRLSEMPDRNPSDQSDMGADVAVRKGPFILDLKQPGNAEDKGLAGKVAIRLPIDDLKGLFDLEQRYAFSFDLVKARENSTLVNVDADDPDVLAMIAAGERSLFLGHAEFRGQTCKSSIAGFDFDWIPTSVEFRFGLSGSVSYLNCQNPDNAGQSISGEESQRGVQMLKGHTTTAQITIHTDHLFWSSIGHENLPMFNQFAANSSNGESTSRVDLEMLDVVPVPGITGRDGRPIPWRSCVEDSLYVLPTQPATMTFDVASQPLTTLRDFVDFNASTLGHLNADGLCYVKKAR